MSTQNKRENVSKRERTFFVICLSSLELLSFRSSYSTAQKIVSMANITAPIMKATRNDPIKLIKYIIAGLTIGFILIPPLPFTAAC
jgi:hypothetical protein